MGFFSSFKKSSNLKRISKVLGQTTDFQSGDVLRSMRETSSNKDKALEELLDICENDKQLSQVIEKYNSNREELKKIYSKLLINGAGQWAGGHLCCASALVFTSTLEYVLENKDSIGIQEGITIVDYFEKGRLGKV